MCGGPCWVARVRGDEAAYRAQFFDHYLFGGASPCPSSAATSCPCPASTARGGAAAAAAAPPCPSPCPTDDDGAGAAAAGHRRRRDVSRPGPCPTARGGAAATAADRRRRAVPDGDGGACQDAHAPSPHQGTTVPSRCRRRRTRRRRLHPAPSRHPFHRDAEGEAAPRACARRCRSRRRRRRPPSDHLSRHRATPPSSPATCRGHSPPHRFAGDRVRGARSSAAEGRHGATTPPHHRGHASPLPQ